MYYRDWLEKNLDAILNECSTIRLHKGPKQYVKTEYSIIADGLAKNMIWLAPSKQGFQLGPPGSLRTMLTLIAGQPTKYHRRYGPNWVITDPNELKRILIALDTGRVNGLQFFFDEAEDSVNKKFSFKPGHRVREVAPLTVTGSTDHEANRLHNDIQNRLYELLAEQLGDGCVGTENNTGSGTLIDLVTRHRDITTSYEIKTSQSGRMNIRQALPQLLEYAYWPEEERADKLVIVSQTPLKPDAARYLQILQKKFQVPIDYQRFDLERNTLC